MEEEQNEPEFVHDDEDSTATCDLCGTPVEGRLSCCSDCIDQRMDFLQQAYDAGRTANSNQPRELVSFLQSLFDEITDKMRSPTWSASEAMPEEVRFLDGDDQYTATLGVLDGPTDDDDAFLCIVCGESLLIDQVYTSDVTSDFRLHAKCALEVCVSMSDASSQSHKVHISAVETPASRPFAPPEPSPSHDVESNPSPSPFSKIKDKIYTKISGKNSSTV